MKSKKSILIFIDWYYPGYLAGGPIQSILSIVENLHNDFYFKIITTNHDLNCPEPYPNILPNTWLKLGLNNEVYYAEPKSLNQDKLLSIIQQTDFDLVYINSFFSVNFSIIPLRILKKHYPTKPVIFAPRGMLGKGALAIKSVKKKLFIMVAKLTGLHSRVIWHATSAQEKSEILEVINPKTDIVTISNLPKGIHLNQMKEKTQNELNLCFVSRVSYKKNLTFALTILKEIKDYKIRYRIYGPIEDQQYWLECERLIAELPKNIFVEYKGNLKPQEVEGVLSNAHAMLLPTLNENFGHSIVESLLCGCPVIISDQTPWNDVEENGAGYALSLDDKDKFKEAILFYAKLNQEEFNQISLKSINYISKKIDLDRIVNQYKQLFNDSIKNGSINI